MRGGSVRVRRPGLLTVEACGEGVAVGRQVDVRHFLNCGNHHQYYVKLRRAWQRRAAPQRMLRGETILLGVEPLGRRERPSRRGGGRRAPEPQPGCPAGSRDAASRRRRTHEVAGGRLCPATPQYRYRERGESQTRHTESGVRPRGVARGRTKRPGTGDRQASTIVASCGRPNHGLSARSIGPGFVARSPEPRFIAARAGASRRTRRGSAIVRHRAAAGCRPSTRRESRRSPIVSLHPKAREPSLRHARRRCIATGAAIVSVL